MIDTLRAMASSATAVVRSTVIRADFLRWPGRKGDSSSTI